MKTIKVNGKYYSVMPQIEDGSCRGCLLNDRSSNRKMIDCGDFVDSIKEIEDKCGPGEVIYRPVLKALLKEL